jgi:YidC/Oxa1 family membrane protein insertase
MPIFMGLYFCLQESVQFRLAKFLWIENLAAPDMLLWWGQTIPWFTDPNSLGGMLYLGPFFNLLPVIAVAFMIVQQKLMAPPPQTEEQQVQQKTMQVMMGVMGLFFYKVAAGLCLYFIASSVWGVAERKMLPKLAPVDTTPTPDKPNQTARDRRRERDRGREKPEPTTNMEKLKDWWQRLLESAEKK